MSEGEKFIKAHKTEFIPVLNTEVVGKLQQDKSLTKEEVTER